MLETEFQPQNCLPPCEGLYLDVTADKNVPRVETFPNFKEAYDNYIQWKKGRVQMFKILYTII